MPDDLPFVPDATLDLIDAGWWLELRCACERSTSISHKRLVKAHGPLARVPDLLRRFRCETCGRSPIRAEWIDNPAGGASGSGYPPKKRVPLRVPRKEPTSGSNPASSARPASTSGASAKPKRGVNRRKPAGSASACSRSASGTRG